MHKKDGWIKRRNEDLQVDSPMHPLETILYNNINIIILLFKAID